MDKEDVIICLSIYISNGILCSHKKSEILSLTTWINSEGIMLIVSQRQIPQDFTYMWKIKDKHANKTELNPDSKI